jgi:D-proline reductase (dithiol) PrdB
MPDRDIRAANANQPIPEFDSPAFNRPPRPLSELRVAIVTTAALRGSDQAKWTGGDQSFRLLPATSEGLILGHISPNFDRSGFVTDPNVVFPIDRLHEMAKEGSIGSVASKHVAFLGAQDETMTTIRLDSGPAAAKVLREDGVDVVLLTPV